MVTECPLCSRGIDHCHGTLVLHSDGTAECTDGTCEGPDDETHVLVLACVQVAGGCLCSELTAGVRAAL
ncbi:MAG: hypothetical protein ABW215_16985 [Kibdelosporangium sp.]